MRLDINMTPGQLAHFLEAAQEPLAPITTPLRDRLTQSRPGPATPAFQGVLTTPDRPESGRDAIDARCWAARRELLAIDRARADLSQGRHCSPTLA